MTSLVLSQYPSASSRLSRKALRFLRDFDESVDKLSGKKDSQRGLDRLVYLYSLMKMVDKLREVPAPKTMQSCIPTLDQSQRRRTPIPNGTGVNEEFIHSTKQSHLFLPYTGENMLMGSVVVLFLHSVSDSGQAETTFNGAVMVSFDGKYIWILFRQAAGSGSSQKRKSFGTQGVEIGSNSRRRVSGGRGPTGDGGPSDGDDGESGSNHDRDDDDDDDDLPLNSLRNELTFDPADPGPGVYRRALKNKWGTIRFKYEPRFKPPREKSTSGSTQKFNHLYLGQYNTPGEAKTVCQVARFYYGKDEGHVALEDGSFFSIPPMNEQEKCLTGKDKAKWVAQKAREVFQDLRRKQVELEQLRRDIEMGAHSGHGRDGGSDPSPSAIAASCSFPASSRSADEHHEIPSVALVELTPSHGGNGAEQLAISVPGDSTHEPTPAIDHVSGVVPVNRSGVQYNVPGKENDAPESDDHGKSAGHADDHNSESLSGFEDILAALKAFDSANISPQQSSLHHNQIHDVGAAEILRDHSSSELDGTLKGFQLVHEPQLSPNIILPQGLDFVSSVSEDVVPSRSILALEQRDPVLGQENHLQQLVICQKKQLKDFAVQCVELQHGLWESEIQKSELQHRLLESEIQISEQQQEIERLRTMLQQAANAQASTWSAGIITDSQQEGDITDSQQEGDITDSQQEGDINP